MDLWNLLIKVLGKKISDGKNYLVMMIVLVVISLNLLGFDIAKLSNTPYIIIILFLFNYIINILTDTYTMNKLSDIQRSLDENNEIIELIENNIEKTDIINANINKIKENNNELAIKIKESSKLSVSYVSDKIAEIKSAIAELRNFTEIDRDRILNYIERIELPANGDVNMLLKSGQVITIVAADNSDFSEGDSVVKKGKQDALC